jgi:hypothetical protein
MRRTFSYSWELLWLDDCYFKVLVSELYVVRITKCLQLYSAFKVSVTGSP